MDDEPRHFGKIGPLSWKIALSMKKSASYIDQVELKALTVDGGACGRDFTPRSSLAPHDTEAGTPISAIHPRIHGMLYGVIGACWTMVTRIDISRPLAP